MRREIELAVQGTLSRSRTYRPTAGMRMRAAARPLPAFARDFGFVVAVIAVYFVARGQAPVNESFAVAFTIHLVDWEKALHIFWEPTIQRWSIHYHPVQEVANAVYAYGHFPILAAVGIWLWIKGRNRFLFLRNTMFISMVFGLLFYYTLPAAPPRLLAAHGYDLGFVDTIFGGHTAVTYSQPSLLLNNYAAVPSFHFGWIALASAAVWVNTENRWLRLIAVLMSAIMFWAIVASANHLFIDMVLGAAIVALSWYLARYLERRSARRQAAIAVPETPATPQS